MNITRKYNYWKIKGKEAEIVYEYLDGLIKRYVKGDKKKFGIYNIDLNCEDVTDNEIIKFTDHYKHKRCTELINYYKRWLIFPVLDKEVNKKTGSEVHKKLLSFDTNFVLGIISTDKKHVNFYSYWSGKKLDPIGKMANTPESIHLTKKQKDLFLKISNSSIKEEHLLPNEKIVLTSLIRKGVVKPITIKHPFLCLTKEGKEVNHP